ncbi:putative membrane protein [Marmoricola sp. URHA0025 HA25]
MSTSTAPPRSVQLPSAPVFVGAVYAVCVLGLIALFTGEIIFSDKDPHRSQGPIASIVTISIVGTAALLIGVGLALWLVRTPERARVGSLVLTGLSVLTIIFFWSGAPGILGACAAWCSGLTKGGRPLGGAARIAGIVGAFVALLNVVLTIGGVLINPFAP